MKIWVKSLISSIILLVVNIVWQIVMLKSINWIEIIVTAIIFGILDLIFFTIESRISKKKNK